MNREVAKANVAVETLPLPNNIESAVGPHSQ